MKQLSQTLHQAAELIKTPGVWAQGFAGTKEGKACAMRVVELAEPSHFRTVLRRLEAFLGDRAVTDPRFGPSVISWNDQPGQTAGNVAYTMNALARDLKSKGL